MGRKIIRMPFGPNKPIHTPPKEQTHLEEIVLCKALLKYALMTSHLLGVTLIRLIHELILSLKI